MHLNHSQCLFKYTPTKNICVHTYIELNSQISCEKVINRLKRKSIIIDGANNNYLSSFPKKDSIININVSNVSEEHIEEGISQILKEVY